MRLYPTSSESQRSLGTWVLTGVIVALLLPMHSVGQKSEESIAPTVDQRVELLSIVFRLADSSEYNTVDLPQYAQNIDRYFAPVKDHPVVHIAKRYADEKGVGFDAVMSMAVSLSSPPALGLQLNSRDSTLDERWGQHTDEDFLPALRDFYTKSHFAEFFLAHEPTYLVAERRLRDVTSRVDLSWFRMFYGSAANVTFRFVIGMNNGSGFYGPRVSLPNGSRDVYAIIGAGPHDTEGFPEFSADLVLPLVIHELSHSFVNPAVDANWSKFNGADRVFESERTLMEKQAYATPKTMVYESLVRSAVIVYFRDHGEAEGQVQRRVREEQLKGFIWMPRLVANIERCEARNRYELTRRTCINGTSSLYAQLAPFAVSKAASFELALARATEMHPFPNHSEAVDPCVNNIEIVFDQAVRAVAGPVTSRTRNRENPVLRTRVVDPRGVTIQVHLLPHTLYGFKVIGASIATRSGHPAEDFFVEFRTR